MSSTLSWLDYDESERRRALDVIDLFRERDTRDELGIGSVRDAFAEMLFPGTSTIQTRAKYFLFVPWTYLEMERRRTPSARAEARGRSEEIALINVLAESEDQDGVIGIEARGTLQRLPSNVYWLGLRTLGIRLFPGSQSQYHRQLDAYYARVNAYGGARSAGEEDGHAEYPRPSWHPGLPPRPAEFPQVATLRLTREEAEYLRERILANAPGTLFAHLVGLSEPFAEADSPWAGAFVPELPERLARQIGHARLFSEVMNGAALLYNLMLAKAQDNEERVADYKGRLADWRDLLSGRLTELEAWDRHEFWGIVDTNSPRIHPATRRFIDDWLDVAANLGILGGNGGIERNESALKLISQRERSIKRNRARLHNQRALELWSGDAGTAPLSYRWGQARTIVLDILEGLTKESAGA